MEKSTAFPKSRKTAEESAAPMVVTLTLGELVKAIRNELAPDLEELASAKPAKPLLDTSELCQFLGVGAPTVAKLRGQGMPFLRVGELYRYDPDAIKEWLGKNSESRPARSSRLNDGAGE